MATVVPLGRCSTADGLSKIAKSLTESRLGMGRPACNYKRSFIQLLECDDSRSGTSEMIGAVSTREGHASKSDLVDVGLDARASSYSLYCWFCNQNQEHGGRSRIRTLDRVLQAPNSKGLDGKRFSAVELSTKSPLQTLDHRAVYLLLAAQRRHGVDGESSPCRNQAGDRSHQNE